MKERTIAACIRTPQKSFTLIELLIAMVISSVVMAAIYATYNAQLKSYVMQQKVVEMHQNARAAMYILERELRLAGYDPLGSGVPGITVAQINAITVTMDITGGEGDSADNDDDGLFDEPGETDGDTDDDFEQVSYRLSNDANNDGIADSLDCRLQRQYWNAASAAWLPNLASDSDDANVAIDIDALNFVYLDADGNDLVNYTLTPPQVPDGVVAAPDRRNEIRTVQITIVARAGRNERLGLPGNGLDTRIYMNQQGRTILPAPNDKYRRIVLTADVKCRNLGLIGP
jgi:type IV pilus assembly protein PilW